MEQPAELFLSPKPTYSMACFDSDVAQSSYQIKSSLCVQKPIGKKMDKRSTPTAKNLSPNYKAALTDSKVRHTDSVQETLLKEFKISSSEVNRRYQHASVLDEGKLYIYGGYESDQGILKDLKIFQEGQLGGKWNDLPTENGPGPRHSHSAVLHSGTIYIFGGKVDRFKNTNTLYAYNIERKIWQNLTPSPAELEESRQWWPSPVDSHKAVLEGDQMYIFGGYQQEDFTNELYSFNFIRKKWKRLYPNQIESIIISPTNQLQSVNKTTEPSGIRLDQLSLSNSQMDSNQADSGEQAPQPRADCTLTFFQNNLYIFGGKDLNQTFGDFWIFSLTKRRFFKIETPANVKEVQAPRSGHSAIMYQHYLLIFGGITAVTHERDDLLCYSTINGDWQVIWPNSQADILPSEQEYLIKQKQKSKPKKISQLNSGDNGGKKNRDKIMINSITEKHCYMVKEHEELLQEKPKKYRRPLREEKVNQEASKRMIEKEATKKKNERKMLLINEIEGSKDGNESVVEEYSPLIESLTNSLNITTAPNKSSMHTAQNSSQMSKTTQVSHSKYSHQPPHTRSQLSKSICQSINDDVISLSSAPNPKRVRARDGHTAHLFMDEEHEDMVIFGGDRHKVGYNDVIFVNLKLLLTTFFNNPDKN